MPVRNTIDLERAVAWLLGVGHETAARAADYLAATARDYCPVDTGYLRSTIDVFPDGSDGFVVAVTAGYAEWVEFGHVAHGTWVPPNPFFRTAVQATASNWPTLVSSVSAHGGPLTVGLSP